ncbi:hypothetical protein Bpfe_024060, partial [Biomphalaria pfeifferi]
PELNKSFSTLLSPTAVSNLELTSSAPPTGANDSVSVQGDVSDPSRNSLLCESADVTRDQRGSRNRLSVP